MLASLSLLSASALSGCGPKTGEAGALPPRASKWLARARASYQTLDMQDAADSVQEALRESPQDRGTRLLAATIALSRLEYAKSLKLTEGLTGTDVLTLRARAYWYNGQIKEAGRTLEQLLRDPDVHDPWAKEVSKLTNRGAGREPFRVDGSIVAAVEMAPVVGGAMVVPVEIDGDQGLALVATGTTEVVLDSSQRKEPAWVSLRFDERVEFHDVPALTQDLTALSRQLRVPIKALLGINFLRHANPTFDRLGRQFVVRRFEPPRPPTAAEVPIYYARGGGMMVSAMLTSGKEAPRANFFIDTSALVPLSLSSHGWQAAGVAESSLSAVPGAPRMKQGTVPLFRIGVFDFPQVQAVTSPDLETVSKQLGISLDGVIGSGLLGEFRVTLSHRGSSMWLEKGFGEASSESPPPPPPTTEPLAPASPGQPSNTAPKEHPMESPTH